MSAALHIENLSKAPGIVHPYSSITRTGDNPCSRWYLSAGRMPARTRHGPIRPFPRRCSGRRPDVEQTAVGGHGARNSFRTVVTRGSPVCSIHRKSVCLTGESAPMGVMICAAMSGRCALANGLRALYPCGVAVFWVRPPSCE